MLTSILAFMLVMALFPSLNNGLAVNTGEEVMTSDFLMNKNPRIEYLTRRWLQEVTKRHDPTAAAHLFCEDGELITPQRLHRGPEIKKYFEYFANLSNITAEEKIPYESFDVVKVDYQGDILINNAQLIWSWDNLSAPISASMTFVFRRNCIFHLHSSVLPELAE
eukprot:Awhi_evm1s4958